MPAPVVIEMMLRGMPAVQNGLRTVEQAVMASMRSQTTSAQRAARERLSIVDREARDKVRAMLRSDQETRRIQDRAVKETERAAKKRAAAEEREMRQMVREAEKSANARIRIEQKVDREFAAMQKKREAENARIIREDERRQEQSAMRIQRIRDRSASMAGRHAAREAEKERREREAFRQRFAGAAFSGVSRGVSAIGRGVAATAGVASQLGGGFSIADSVKEVAELERSAVRFSNAAYMGTGSRIDPKALQAQAKAASIATGISPNELMAGAHAFLAKTGAPGESMANMRLFGEIATGTGASIEDVAKAAGTLRVQNKDLTGEGMKSILLQTVRQGQKGSIEFSDLATAIGKITRTSSGYVGKQEKTQAELLGIAQLGMATMSDPRDVATSLAGIESDTKKHWQKMQGALGPNTFDKMGRITTGPSEFIANVMEKTGGDTRKLQELGFGKQAMKYFQALAPEFQEAGGGAAGKDKILTKMREAVAEPMSDSELKDNVKTVLNTSAAQFETSMTQLKVAVGEQLMPEFVKLAGVLKDSLPALKSVLQVLVRFASWAEGHPFAAITGVLAASITRSVAEAGLKQILEKSVAQSIGSGGGIAVAGATIAITSAILAIEAISQAHSAQVSKDINTSNAAVSEAMGVRLGDKTTQEDVAALTAKRDAMAADVARQREGVNSKDAMEYVGMAGKVAAHIPLIYAGLRAAGTDPDAQDTDMSAEYQRSREERLKQAEQGLKAYNDALQVATENLKRFGAVQPPQGGGATGGKPIEASTGIAQRPKS